MAHRTTKEFNSSLDLAEAECSVEEAPVQGLFADCVLCGAFGGVLGTWPVECLAVAAEVVLVRFSVQVAKESFLEVVVIRRGQEMTG